MTSEMFDRPLPIARYRFQCALDAPLVLPDYAGSMLRGAFGAALRRTSCMTGLPSCAPCPLYRTCPYPALFESPPRETSLNQQFSQVPNPYVIEPPPLGTRQVGGREPLVFSMVLVGQDALRQLPLIVHSWQRALRHGLGRQRIPGELLKVQWEGDTEQFETVFEQPDPKVREHGAELFIPTSTAFEHATLHIHTPLRLQQQGSPLHPAQLTVRTLALAAARRASLMLGLHAGVTPPEGVAALIAETEQLREDRSELRWYDWTRFSSRQQQEMTLGGVIGPWKLQGAMNELLPWLWLGQWLHLGKNATMGLGHYRLALGPRKTAARSCANVRKQDCKPLPRLTFLTFAVETKP